MFLFKKRYFKRTFFTRWPQSHIRPCLTMSWSRAAESEEIESPRTLSAACVKTSLFQPSVTKSCSLMGGTRHSSVILDLRLPRIFSLSLDLHLPSFSHCFFCLLGVSDCRTSSMVVAGLLLLLWQIIHTINLRNRVFFPEIHVCVIPNFSICRIVSLSNLEYK